MNVKNNDRDNVKDKGEKEKSMAKIMIMLYNDKDVFCDDKRRDKHEDKQDNIG